MKGFKGSCQRGRAGVVNSARLFYAEGTMTDIAIFWDASQLWGLLVWRAAEAFGLPYRLVKAKEIAQGALSDKTSLLLVPGGTARHKSAALGEKGREAVRAWVRGGGRYVGSAAGPGLGFPMPPILCVPPKSVRACACARGTVRKSANACSTSFPGTSASVFRAGIRLSRNFFPNPSPPAPNRLSRSGGRALCGVIRGP